MRPNEELKRLAEASLVRERDATIAGLQAELASFKASSLETMGNYHDAILTAYSTISDLQTQLAAEGRQSLDGIISAVKRSDKWRTWACEVGGRPEHTGNDEEVRAMVMEFIADLRELLEFKRKEIATLTQELQRRRTVEGTAK